MNECQLDARPRLRADVVGVATAAHSDIVAGMDLRHKNALRRAAQADKRLEDDGQGPQEFHLIHTGGMQSEIDHPRWDRSWAAPSELDIDDLEELGLVRITQHDRKTRSFVLTIRGRDQGRALDESVRFPVSTGGGRAPDAVTTLRWLVAAAQSEPAILDLPDRIIDHAVTAGLIDVDSRQPLARRILQLRDEGYLSGEFLDFDQISPEQELAHAQNLSLTVKAHEVTRERPANSGAGTSITIVGDLVNSQIAAGDISNETTFVNVLARAEVEIDALAGIDAVTKEQAKGLIRTMLGRGATTGGQVITEAAGALAATVISKLLGLQLG
jgi:hypothetical protein